MKNHPKSIKGTRGFTLIEVSIAIALVAIGLTVGLLGYNGYRSWAQETAQRNNARNLAAATGHARAHGVVISGNGHIFPREATVARANEIYSQIDGNIPVGNSTVHIIPEGFALSGGSLPSGWLEVSAGRFGPIP